MDSYGFELAILFDNVEVNNFTQYDKKNTQQIAYTITNNKR